ncbi:MAG TPA: N-acetylglucosamine-6-phosphate deacetylase [Jatrophihabitans sp.]|nr:N-acetylglucosamine-6-phosphate deacetylase [Jatrophihabitans sp.]
MSAPVRPGRSSVLVGARVVLPDRVLPDGWVAVRDGRIEAVGTGAPPDGDATDLGGGWLLPGFIDLHMHGGGGHDVTASAAKLAAAVDFHRSHGTTRTLVSLVSAPLDALAEQLGWIAELHQARPDQVLGAHLEGPFLSPARRGAHHPEYLRYPDVTVFDALADAARGTLRVLTLAPELPGALDVIAAARARGVIVAVGHTDADYDATRAAIDAGARLATHLFNGMRPLHHREPGVVGAALAADLPCELINDGVHVHPSIVALVARSPGRLVLVTDAIDAAGLGDAEVVLGGQQVRVQNGQARLVSDGTLAGSTLTMADAVRAAVLDSGIPIEVAAAGAATNPARVLGIGAECGAITAGAAADLVLLDDDLRLQRVMAGGRWCPTQTSAQSTTDAQIA